MHAFIYEQRQAVAYLVGRCRIDPPGDDMLVGHLLARRVMARRYPLGGLSTKKAVDSQ